uniref:E3 ubiquitin-protein ligase n=1 Tax=Arion vulgaris TaxID=1028688 RepID=A0A0B7AIV6_9EUPU
MAGVVVWSYKNNRDLWSVYEPNVSSELEKLFCQRHQQNVNLGTISPNLSCYEVNFLQMTQRTISSGSVRDIKRNVCDPASAVGQGVIWEFEGDQPSQWSTYDLETMDVIESGFSKMNQLNTLMLDLRQTHVHLPYVIDFGTMTQIRVETGRVRRIQRRPLTQVFTPVSSHSFGLASTGLPLQSSFQGHANWQSLQHVPKSHTTKSKTRHQPYTINNKSGTVAPSGVNGAYRVSGAPSNITSQVLQVQSQTSQTAGPLTRRKLQQTVGSHHSTMHQQSLVQHAVSQQVYNPQPFLQHAVHNLHLSGPYQHLFGHVPVSGSLASFSYPSPSIVQPLTVSSGNTVHQSLTHQQMSRPSSTSSLSSSSSSMSVSSSQGSESLPSVFKISIGKSKKTKGKAGLEVLKKYMSSVHTNLDTNDCSICFDKLSEASSYGEGHVDAHATVQLIKCGHQFHKLCLLEMYNRSHKDDSLQCPSCKMIYGEKTGICPPGYMNWRVVHDLALSGYEGHGTIIVSYHISPGIQGPEHPSPGQAYSARGFPRQGFLPDCDKGRKVLKLLMEAFKRRLMFTIATSNTTGEINTVTWNEIHHKTEPHGNHSGHGYPDPQYLDNVLMELAAHGVTEDCLR